MKVQAVWERYGKRVSTDPCPLAQYKGDTMPKIIKDERTCDKEVKND